MECDMCDISQWWTTPALIVYHPQAGLCSCVYLVVFVISRMGGGWSVPPHTS